MAFTPPGFASLRVQTHNLNSSYSTMRGRYKIVNNLAGEAPSAVPQNSLELLIARINKIAKCETERESARDTLDLLANEMRQILQENEQSEDKIGHATLILLGALIHRYFRIINEYENKGGYIKWTAWGYSPTDSGLFMGVRAALQLKALDSKTIKNYKVEDMAVLDVVTIVNALKAFQENMLLEDKETKVPRYKKYPHFADDSKHFLPYLQEIIEAQTKRGVAYLRQFKAIAYIQSLGRQLEKEQQQVDEELDKWVKILSKDHKDFSKLTFDAIEQHIKKHIKVESIREKVLDLLYTDRIKDNLKKMSDHVTFLKDMKACYGGVSSYTLFGAYALLLRSPDLDQKLKFCMQQALGADDNSEELTEQDLLDAIKFLKKYNTDNPDLDLNYEYFDGKEKMNTAISNVEFDLASLILEHGANIHGANIHVMA